MQIPITRPCLGKEEEVAAGEAIRSGWLTQGPRVAAFEEAVASYCDADYAVAVSSCTTALHLSLLALGVGEGDEVICPSMSYIATANSIAYTGAIPVFADVNDHFNIDPDRTEALITDRTKAIMVVHQIGLPAEIDRFIAIGKKHDIPVLEDAACAIGSRYRDQAIGAQTEMAAFSFHPRKVLTTGDGGVVTTNNEAYANKLRLLRQHGMSVSDTVRHNSKTIIVEQYSELGYNYRMTDVQAAIGIEQMKRLEEIVGRRRLIAGRYNQAFRDHRWLDVIEEPSSTTWNYQSYPLILKKNAPISRDRMMQLMLDKNIATRRGIMLAHMEPVYRDTHLRESLSVSIDLNARSCLIPLFPDLSDTEQEAVISALQDVFA